MALFFSPFYQGPGRHDISMPHYVRSPFSLMSIIRGFLFKLHLPSRAAIIQTIEKVPVESFHHMWQPSYPSLLRYR